MPRNYYRSPSDVTFTVHGFTRAVKVLLIITGCVYFVETLASQIALLAPVAVVLNWCGLSTTRFVHGAFWVPITYLFLHENLAHLLWNMFGLWMFGVDVEQALGERRFYWLYFVCGAGAGLIDIASHLITNTQGYTIGASGAIYGVLLAFAMLYPDRPVFLMLPPVTVKGKWLALIFGGLEFVATFNPQDHVAHFAHLGGMLFAFIFLRSRLPFGRLREQYTLWRRRRLQRRFEIYMSNRDRRTGTGGPWVH